MMSVGARKLTESLVSKGNISADPAKLQREMIRYSA